MLAWCVYLSTGIPWNNMIENKLTTWGFFFISRINLNRVGWSENKACFFVAQKLTNEA